MATGSTTEGKRETKNPPALPQQLAPDRETRSAFLEARPPATERNKIMKVSTELNTRIGARCPTKADVREYFRLLGARMDAHLAQHFAPELPGLPAEPLNRTTSPLERYHRDNFGGAVIALDAEGSDELLQKLDALRAGGSPFDMMPLRPRKPMPVNPAGHEKFIEHAVKLDAPVSGGGHAREDNEPTKGLKP